MATTVRPTASARKSASSEVQKVLDLIKEKKLQVVDVKFCDLPGTWQHFSIPAATLDLMQGLDVLVLDCVRIKPHSTHLCLEEALAIIEDLAPKRAFLTHLNHDILFERDKHLLPDNVQLAFDELVVE